MLAKFLVRVARDYSQERKKPFAGSDFGRFVRSEVVGEARKQLSTTDFDLTVKASVGQGYWASVPWLAYFDPLITDTATKGFYVVFLVNPQKQTFVLSLNQAATEIYNEFGERRGLDVLARRARDFADRLPKYRKLFSEDPIDLSSNERLPAGYKAGHVFGRTYTATSVAEEQLADDLKVMLTAYRALVDRGGIVPTEIMQEEVGGSNIDETRRYILSRRIERSPRVRRDVLRSKPLICECCGLDPVRDYGCAGGLVETPLDVHHSKPLYGMSIGETRRYVVPDDFLILCPTCHRMIHKQDDPADIGRLRSNLRFKRT